MSSVDIVEVGESIDWCAVFVAVVGETKSEKESQADVSIQKVDLSPPACTVLTMLGIVWERRRWRCLDGVKGVSRKMGRAIVEVTSSV